MNEQSPKQRKLTEPERLWLLEASDPKFDPKVARIKLHGRLPNDFDPKKLDSRLYANNKITPLGLYLLNPEELFKALTAVIKDIREQIFAHPGIVAMSAADVATRTNLPKEQVGRALWVLADFAQLFSSYSVSDLGYVSQFNLNGEDAYDELIRDQSVDELVERAYNRRSAFVVPNVISPADAQLTSGGGTVEHIAVKRNAAFVLMAIDPDRPELEDVYNAVRDVCADFGINAQRADLIEHQDRITDVILEEIVTCEFLIADLSYERPNVYYEVGYAHALRKKPILYRREGTRLHFDLSVHNVPEYKNVTQLRELLTRRLEAILGRGPKSK